MGHEPATLLNYLQKTLSAPPTDAPDAELLDRFVRNREESAFAAMLRRHGAMVWSVCRRVLFDAGDVEDAFQATFLVLVRRASAIGRREQLGNWLYGVALRTALKARSLRARRHTTEMPAAGTPEPTTRLEEPLLARLWPILDEELAQLPDKYRRPVVLCYLEGLTRTEAASVLGWPPGTVAGRLARALDRLRARLARHGVSLPAAALAAALSESASAAPSPHVAAAILQWTAATAPGVGVPMSVQALAKGVLKAMWLTRMKSFTITCLAVLLVTGGGALALFAATTQPPDVDSGDLHRIAGDAAKQEDKEPAGPAARPAKGAKALHTFKDDNDVSALVFSPDGKALYTASHRVKGPDHGHIRRWNVDKAEKPNLELSSIHSARAVAVSSDGKLLAMSTGGLLQGQRSQPGDLKLFDAENGNLKATIMSESHSYFALAFSPDDKTLAGGSFHFDDKGKRQDGGVIRLWDVDNAKEFAMLKGHRGMIRSVAFARNGKTLASASGEAPPPGKQGAGEIKLWDLTTGKEKASWNHTGPAWCVAFSPDGNILASAGEGGDIKLWDVAKSKEVGTLKGHKRKVVALAFAPDGATLASGGGDPGGHPSPAELKLWDVAAQKEIVSLGDHEVTVMCVAFDKQGKRLASGDMNGRIVVWDVQ